MDKPQVDDYLARIGAKLPVRVDVDALRELQVAHLRTVPFENLSIHLGEPIVLTEAALFDKIVNRRRGGFCYELNGMFGALLTALGYRVELLSARVFGGGRFGPPFDHLALRIDLGEPWLVDVGFGRFADAPLRLDVRGDQPIAGDCFRIEPDPDDGTELTVRMNGAPEYRLDDRAYALADFVPTCWWQQTSPYSHFTGSLTCSRLTERGRVTLSGNRLITTTGGERVEEILGSDADVLGAYRDQFGIELARVPTVTPRAS